jgi:hypothetical protein
LTTFSVSSGYRINRYALTIVRQNKPLMLNSPLWWNIWSLKVYLTFYPNFSGSNCQSKVSDQKFIMTAYKNTIWFPTSTNWRWWNAFSVFSFKSQIWYHCSICSLKFDIMSLSWSVFSVSTWVLNLRHYWSEVKSFIFLHFYFRRHSWKTVNSNWFYIG